MKAILDFFHHLFVPKEGNNYRAKALHTDFLTYYLLFAILLTFSFKNLGGDLRNVLGFATDITIDKLYQLTNDVRQKNNLSNLGYNEKLSAAAYKKAQDMFAKNYWAHYAPDGATPWDFILASGYQYEYAGENLAKNFLFSQGVVDAWMNSPTHRENLLRKDYTEIGFAVVNGLLNGEETTLVVQMFGKPLTYQATKQPETPVQKEPAVPVAQPKEAILAKKSTSTKVSPINLPFDINLIFLAFLFIALLMDFYFAAHFNIIRISGKNLAHLIFVGFIFLGLLFLTRGSII